MANTEAIAFGSFFHAIFLYNCQIDMFTLDVIPTGLT